MAIPSAPAAGHRHHGARSRFYPWTAEAFPEGLDAPANDAYISDKSLQTCSRDPDFDLGFFQHPVSLGRKVQGEILRYRQARLLGREQDKRWVYEQEIASAHSLVPVLHEIASQADVDRNLLTSLLDGAPNQQLIQSELPRLVSASSSDFVSGLDAAWWVHRLRRHNGAILPDLNHPERVSVLVDNPQQGLIKARLWRDEALTEAIPAQLRRLLPAVSSRIVTCVRVIPRARWTALWNSKCEECITEEYRRQLLKSYETRIQEDRVPLGPIELQQVARDRLQQDGDQLPLCTRISLSALAAESVWFELPDTSGRGLLLYQKVEAQTFRRGFTSVVREAEKISLDRAQYGNQAPDDLWACHQNDGMM
jgi:hypothetical protein